jgi:lipopolysaccharide export system protein LptA
VSEDNNIYTHSGWYDTQNDISLLLDSVKLIHKEQELTADSVYYEKKTGFGIAQNRVTIIDTTRNFIVKGEYGQYSEKGGWSWMTDSALLILIDKENNDSLFLHADTLRMFFDSAQNPQWMMAYFHVKFLSKDLQGVCDSMIYNVEDSVGYMYYNPVVWNKKNQMFGDTISFSVIDSINSLLKLLKDAFVITDVYGEEEFNQVKGKNIFGYIRDKGLQQVDVVNNVELLYYVMDEDSLLIGINCMETNEMKMFFEDNEIVELRFYDYPDGKFWADKELPMKDRKLKDFRWLDAYRPKEIRDIFNNPIPRPKGVRNEE